MLGRDCEAAMCSATTKLIWLKFGKEIKATFYTKKKMVPENCEMLKFTRTKPRVVSRGSAS